MLLYRIAEAKEDRGEIVVRNPRADAREPPKSFFFDAVFGDRSAQERVYEVCGAPLVESVLQGYNGTIFAYGQVRNDALLANVEDILGCGGFKTKPAANRIQAHTQTGAGGIRSIHIIYTSNKVLTCIYQVCIIGSLVSMYRICVALRSVHKPTRVRSSSSSRCLQSRFGRCVTAFLF